MALLLVPTLKPELWEFSNHLMATTPLMKINCLPTPAALEDNTQQTNQHILESVHSRLPLKVLHHRCLLYQIINQAPAHQETADLILVNLRLLMGQATQSRVAPEPTLEQSHQLVRMQLHTLGGSVVHQDFSNLMTMENLEAADFLALLASQVRGIKMQFNRAVTEVAQAPIHLRMVVLVVLDMGHTLVQLEVKIIPLTENP
ncbi:hypothetical protein MSG28_010997 [Choristoneura fumiferana]|uniref:Uncharacterized protein n=1 Tax=Choristoneura fumiferana TaxID=7141 RepID=A0ACC0KQJ2_CHOFU|nr:hypothetical protein MSG28_010997 [Choristoneura fumiferana]